MSMDLGSVATGLVGQSIGASLNVDVLKAVQNLDKTQAAMLAASIGLGGHVDAYASRVRATFNNRRADHTPGNGRARR